MPPSEPRTVTLFMPRIASRNSVRRAGVALGDLLDAVVVLQRLDGSAAR